MWLQHCCPSHLPVVTIFCGAHTLHTCVAAAALPASAMTHLRFGSVAINVYCLQGEQVRRLAAHPALTRLAQDTSAPHQRSATVEGVRAQDYRVTCVHLVSDAMRCSSIYCSAMQRLSHITRHLVCDPGAQRLHLQHVRLVGHAFLADALLY